MTYVGVRRLYNGGHIPGAQHYGPGSTEQGIADSKKYATTLPKNSEVVLYCGCCPLVKCPNLRPAISFHVDWAEKGYPVQKGN